MSGNGDIGHLEGDIAAVANNLRADLDEFLPKARQRPIFDGSGVASARRKLPRLLKPASASLRIERRTTESHCDAPRQRLLQQPASF
jgi:hypothetical protein